MAYRSPCLMMAVLLFLGRPGPPFLCYLPHDADLIHDFPKTLLKEALPARLPQAGRGGTRRPRAGAAGRLQGGRVTRSQLDRGGGAPYNPE